MALLAPSDLVAALPADLRDAAAADAEGKTAAILAEVCAAAEREVEGCLGAASLGEAARKQAAIWIAMDLLFVRRNLVSERVAAQADAWRKYLRELAAKAGPTASTAAGGGAVIGEPARTRSGSTLV